MPEANVYEARARAAKSYKLSRVIVRACRAAQIRPDQWATASPAVRARAAGIAGVRRPSEATWMAAVTIANETMADA